MCQVTVLLILNFRGRSILNLEDESDDRAFKVKNTLIFNAFVLCQIFNELNARKPDEINVWKGVTKNRLFMGIVGLTVVLHVIYLILLFLVQDAPKYLEIYKSTLAVHVIIIFFLGKFSSTVRLSWKLWLVSVVIGIISWPLVIVGKLIPVPERPFSDFFMKQIRKERESRGKENLLGVEHEGNMRFFITTS
ncbi:unnamed protein product [Fraxinus pennsylvanica]|uniref:Cation-transporting P-type ATPase C-terminal domain-containing protein n=1 Tax=Fraxinus pennsylvanica TaxID=56036 RepID=A0AAD1ZFJ5_9LAMI|nr:unnamed protein product [Fraxinus pennsylvanica]